MVGYTDTGYTVIDHNTKKVTATCDVGFLENRNISSFDLLTHESFPITETNTSSNRDQAIQTEKEILVPDANHTEVGTQMFTPANDHTYASYAMQITQPRPKRLLEETVPKNYDQIAGNVYETDGELQ